MDDPIETEQWLALNAYLCFCSAFGCFYGAMEAYQHILVYLDEMFAMGSIFAGCGMILLALADYHVPTTIWRHFVSKAKPHR